ncbi:MAG: imidazoleglycerol-phosphate dehydratase HisB [Candidatus Melainabacteria bacterium]|nr:imidazoleglycerol-phosphate dehydratase HisB [Candidatus Melainabacteria bacterium]
MSKVMEKASPKIRMATVERNTKETQIKMTIDLDSSGKIDIDTNLPFLSHMLEAFACHGRFSLSVKAKGDIEVDPHHLIEDCGIVLGEVIYKALGGLSGIERAGSFTFPMDGSLAVCAMDICGRRNLTWNVKFGNFTVGGIDPNLFREFFKGFVDGLKATLHVHIIAQDNDHHVIEAVYKACARALKQCVKSLDNDEYLSTKGMLDEN